MADLKKKVIPPEPPKIPPPRGRNSKDLQVYRQYLIEHSDVPGVYEKIGGANAAVEKARDARKAKEEAEKEKKKGIQDTDVESSDGNRSIREQ